MYFYLSLLVYANCTPSPPLDYEDGLIGVFSLETKFLNWNINNIYFPFLYLFLFLGSLNLLLNWRVGLSIQNILCVDKKIYILGQKYLQELKVWPCSWLYRQGQGSLKGCFEWPGNEL